MTKEAIARGPLPEEMYSSVVDRLKTAKWTTTGGMTPEGTVHATYGLPMVHAGDISPEDAAVQLGLVDEDGKLLEGFNVYDAHAIFGFVVSYSGYYDYRLAAAADRMIELTTPQPESS